LRDKIIAARGRDMRTGRLSGLLSRKNSSPMLPAFLQDISPQPRHARANARLVSAEITPWITADTFSKSCHFSRRRRRRTRDVVEPRARARNRHTIAFSAPGHFGTSSSFARFLAKWINVERERSSPLLPSSFSLPSNDHRDSPFAEECRQTGGA